MTKNLEYPVSTDLDAGVSKLLTQMPMELSTSKSRLLLSLPPDQSDDQILVDFSPSSPPPLLVVVLPGHAHLQAQPLDAYSASSLEFLARPVDA